MKRIEMYLDELYREVRNSEEASELKAEMRCHLTQAVEELMVEGLSEEESVQIALERFGDQRLLVLEMDGVLQVQRTFAKQVLRTALVFLVVGIMALLGFTWKQVAFEQDLERRALQIVGDSSSLTSTMQNQLVEMVQSTRLLNDVQIELDPNFSSEVNPSTIFAYQKEPLKHRMWILPGYSGITYSNNHFVIVVRYFDLKWTGVVLFAICLVVYWVLFAVWGVVNAYHSRRFHWAWVLAFALLNVLGLAIYWGEKKRVQRVSFA